MRISNVYKELKRDDLITICSLIESAIKTFNGESNVIRKDSAENYILGMSDILKLLGLKLVITYHERRIIRYFINNKFDEPIFSCYFFND